MISVLHGIEGGGLDSIFFMWMISEKIKYEEPKEATLINNVHVKRIYTFCNFEYF